MKLTRTFADWLLLGEESAAASNVGGGNVAGLGVGKQGEPGVYLPRRRKAEIYKSAVRLAQFKQGQKPSRPNRWRRILQQTKQSTPDI